MSHTLHRRGSKESLQNDFPLLSRPSIGINNIGSGDKLREFTKIAMRHNPTNLGMSKKGNLYTTTSEEIIEALEDNRTVNVVFANKEDYTAFLKELVEHNWDLSVTTGALRENVEEVCAEVGIVPHSVNLSIGIFGKLELLPPEEILAFTTMCGHHQIAPALVEALIDKVKKGKTSPHDAAVSLARHCPCGAFNTARAEDMFKQYLEKME